MHETTRARSRACPGVRSGAFTLIEVMIVILIVALLMAILLVGVRAAARASQRVADAQTANTLATAVEQFKQDNGFLPPLAYDGAPLPVDPPALIDQGIGDGAYDWANGNDRSAPVVEISSNEKRFVAVYNKRRDLDFLRAGVDSGGNEVRQGELTNGANRYMSDSRYSKFSLPIYLSGIQERDIDGRDGPGMTKPSPDGTFAGIAGEGSVRPLDAYVQPTGDLLQVDSSYAEDIEAREHTGNRLAVSGTNRPFTQAFVDRYGRAFRYYRWEHGRNSVDVADEGGSLGLVAEPGDLNIPYVLQDMTRVLEHLSDHQVDATDGNVELRGASYAIVGAGQDGYFGTERLQDMDPANTAKTPEAAAAFRARRQADNIVAVGQ